MIGWNGRWLTVPLLLLWPLGAIAQDAAQLARLEQDVRQLQREVSLLSQLVNQLRMRSDASGAAPATAVEPRRALPSDRPAVRPSASLPRWVSSAAWRNVAAGMTELDVVGELGPPSSVRGMGGERVLLYALEMGPGVFLAGSVTLRDRAVASVETPTLK